MFEKDKEITPVIFRVYQGELCAYFPAEPWDIFGNYIACYAHIGQHGASSLDWLQKGRPATENEYAGLKKELEGFGYNLRVYKRVTSKHRITRHRQITAWRKKLPQCKTA